MSAAGMLNALSRRSSSLEGQSSGSALGAVAGWSPWGDLAPCLDLWCSAGEKRNVIKMYLSLSLSEAQAVTHTTLPELSKHLARENSLLHKKSTDSICLYLNKTLKV